MKIWQAVVSALVSLLAGVLGAVVGAVVGFGAGLLVLQECRDRMECEDIPVFWVGGGVVFGVGAAVTAWRLMRRMTDSGEPQ